MRPKTIVGLCAIAGFSALLLFSFGQQVGEYVSFSEAEAKGTQVHVVGEWVQDELSFYDPEQNLFSFHMKDAEGVIRQVSYRDVKPASFEDAEKIVVKGRLEKDVFVAEHILMKCPSKYNDERALDYAPKSSG